MTTKDYKKSHFSLFGAFSFFVLVALLMQVAILVYDYICDRTDDTSLIAVLILILIFILSTVITVFDFFRRKIMVDRPVKRILDATERIARGDFSTRIEITHTYEKYNEFDIIAENLNAMAAEFQKSEVMKNDFISNVSHELKTPLAVIGNYAKALSDPELDFESREKYAKTLVSASSRLSELVSNILKLNKLENHQLKPEIQRVNLSDMLAEAIVSYEANIEDKEIELEVSLDDVYVNSSPALLELVWNNLISNAVKFTEPGGRVSVLLFENADKAVVRVSDTGCGMSREVGMRIFEKFYQGDSSHSGEGNGLGLALVKKVIDILGGEISVTSEIGKGSSFTVTLKK
ncbi:MAG: HAMP domain-containing histidine kinase [Clostridia bacterium]|nr:HAMP domain-containing histidine kinase [Clostridia bacterium]